MSTISSMSQQEWEDLDRDGRQVVFGFLEKLGFASICNSTGNCSWDLSAVACDGHRIGVECKDRKMTHDRYGDHEIEKHKFVANDLMIRRGEFDAFIVASTFKDGYLAVSNLYDPDRQEVTQNCNNATMVRVWSSAKRPKEMVHYPQTKLFRFNNNNGRLTFKEII